MDAQGRNRDDIAAVAGVSNKTISVWRQDEDYIALKKAGVKFYKTPDAILKNQLDAWDKIIVEKQKDNPFFKRVLDSQKAFAERAGRWQTDYMVDFKPAWNRYFGGKKG